MRHLSLLLLLIFVNCKSETKTETKTESESESRNEVVTEIQTENKIDLTVSEMWNDFTESNPEFKEDELPEASYFHNNEADANRLGELILNGKKKAGSGLHYWYEEANADLPKIGTKSIVTDFNGKALAIIEIKKVDTIPFNQISVNYAEMDMGTTSEPLKKWKEAHWKFFADAMKQGGKKPTEEMLIVCEWFETIWPEKK